jgi:hypothetical protein
VPDAPATSPPKDFRSLPVTLPDTSLAIPRNDQRRDLFPIRPPEPPRPARRQSLAHRRRRQLIGA